MTAVKGAMEWAAQMGHIEHSPIAKLKKPRPRIRELVIPAIRWPEVIAGATDESFPGYLLFMLDTGARPHEMVAPVNMRTIDFG